MMTKSTFERLRPGMTYHIYNRAVGDELMFRSGRDYLTFLVKMSEYLEPFLKIHAYCLIPNHFHLLLDIRNYHEIAELCQMDDLERITKKVNQSFSNFFNSYAVTYNRKYQRKGKLFMLPYRRILVEDEEYFLSLLNYIHHNPVHHGLIASPEDWPYSSYRSLT